MVRGTPWLPRRAAHVGGRKTAGVDAVRYLVGDHSAAGGAVQRDLTAAEDAAMPAVLHSHFDWGRRDATHGGALSNARGVTIGEAPMVPETSPALIYGWVTGVTAVLHG